MSKTTETRDVQSLAFGVNANAKMAMAFGAASASSPTSLTTVTTASGANCFAGQAVWANSAANTATQGTAYYGVIQSNTSGANSVLTVDGWTTVAGAAGSTPSSTTYYIIGPPPPQWFIALSDDTDSVAGTETGTNIAVTGGMVELSTNGLSRGLADTLTHTAGTSTVVLGKTFTYTGSGAQTVGRIAIVNSRVLNKGFAYFISALSSAATPSANGDTVTITDTITVG